MSRKLSSVFSTVGAALVVLSLTPPAEAGPPPTGIAILSPLESPDPPYTKHERFLGPVRITPYYPGYHPPAQHGPLLPLFGKRGTGGCCGSAEGPVVGAVEVAGAGSDGYGAYSGGPRDESRLRNLGGGGAGAAPMTPPAQPPLSMPLPMPLPIIPGK
jgi:hypothetical protein